MVRSACSCRLGDCRRLYADAAQRNGRLTLAAVRQIFAQDLAIALSAEPDDVAPPMVVCMLDLDKNDVPRPWGNFMDVSTIVFYPSADPTNPQFLIDAVSPCDRPPPIVTGKCSFAH